MRNSKVLNFIPENLKISLVKNSSNFAPLRKDRLSSGNLQESFSNSFESPNLSPNSKKKRELIPEGFEYVKILGQGCHGVVKLLYNPERKRFEACKSIRTDDEEIILQAKTEYSILKILDHPYIIKSYDLVQENYWGIIFVLLEYVDYPNLEKLHKSWVKTKKVTGNSAKIEFEAAHIILMILKGLEYLHSQYVVHRDLKPSNILVSQDLNDLKIIDFGVSKRFEISEKEEIDSDQEETKIKSPVKKKFRIEMLTPTGTPEYKAPEMFRDGIFNEKIDIYACGIILLEILRGRKSRLSTKVHISESQEVHNLISLMLNFTPDLRPSAKLAISHDWFKKTLSLKERKRSTIILDPKPMSLVPLTKKMWEIEKRDNLQFTSLNIDQARRHNSLIHLMKRRLTKCEASPSDRKIIGLLSKAEVKSSFLMQSSFSIASIPEIN